MVATLCKISFNWFSELVEGQNPEISKGVSTGTSITLALMKQPGCWALGVNRVSSKKCIVAQHMPKAWAGRNPWLHDRARLLARDAPTSIIFWLWSDPTSLCT